MDPHTDFIYPEESDPAAELRELRTLAETHREQAERSLELLLAFLFSGKMTRAAILARALALGIACRHEALCDRSQRDLGRELGISHVAISRLRREVVPMLLQLAVVSRSARNSVPECLLPE